MKMKITKKRFVLITLFIFPLLFFLFLSTGINSFEKLPILTETVSDVQKEDTSLKNQVTVLCFLGKEMDSKKGGFFNLNQKIYKEFYGYHSFQIIAVYPERYKEQADKLKSEIGAFTNMSRWRFVEMSEEGISSLFLSLKTSESLDYDLYSNRAFLIDKNLNLRGRNDDKDAKDGKLFGYNMQSVAELNNKMEDDIKVLLYEYRAALKNRNKADRKELGL